MTTQASSTKMAQKCRNCKRAITKITIGLGGWVWVHNGGIVECPGGIGYRWNSLANRLDKIGTMAEPLREEGIIDKVLNKYS